MRFHIKTLVLWSRNEKNPPRLIHFAPNRLNVITGASKTGKSAIIPIIDYCLGSDRCAIPVQTIRNACSWFGIVVTTSEGEKLFARREPGQQQSTGDMYFAEGAAVAIPDTAPEKNTTVDSVKHLLDDLAGLSTLSFDATSPQAGFKARPSFRDMLAFTFQPQNIVANPDVLFFRADTVEHKEKLRTIFPYALGAVTPDLLAARWEAQQVALELRRKERELSATQQVSEQWKAAIHDWVNEARDLGLVQPDEIATAGETEKELVSLLSTIAAKTSADSVVEESAFEASAAEIGSLDREESDVTLTLSELRTRAASMTRLRGAVGQYSGAIEKQRDRLELSRWLRDQSTHHKTGCPICGQDSEPSATELNVLCDALANVEATARHIEPIPASFDKELIVVREQVRLFTDRLKAVSARRALIEARSQRLSTERWKRAAIDRFTGRLEHALKVLSIPFTSTDLFNEVAELRDRLAALREAASDSAALKRQQAALGKVSRSMARLLPRLDTERPEDSAELNINDLTIRVTGGDGRSDYLWEIGSGANWVSYHLAALLSLHSLFASIKSSPVPALLVLDQPSQVYFPRKLAGKAALEADMKVADEDVSAVQKTFRVLGDAAASKPLGLQVIVLDHAGSDIWGDMQTVHLVEEWRDGRALIPKAWLEELKD